MNYFIDTAHIVSKKAECHSHYKPFLTDLSVYLEKSNGFNSQESYTAFISGIQRIIRKHTSRFQLKTAYHKKEIGPILEGRALTEKTAWGGVTLKKVDVDRNFIRKLLVINTGGVLGFEYHDFKHERLEVKEGVCLLISSIHKGRGWKKGKVTIQLSVPSDRTMLLPYDEHGVIAISNCVIEEKSTNHLDDLKFIYTS